MKKYLLLSASLLALSVSMPAFADDTVNNSSIDQIGTGLSVTLTQTGDRNHNTSSIEQGLVVSGDALSADILQTGEDTTNEANLTQDGSDQTALVEQRGLGLTNNFASIVQDGTNNSVDVLQNGTGNNNDAVLTQHGTGALNTIDLDQGGMGSTNNSTVTQNGGALTATIVQN
jgi:Curlin associated repeat